HFGKRTPLSAAVSKDGGKTWSKPRHIETDAGWAFSNPGGLLHQQGHAVSQLLGVRVSRQGVHVELPDRPEGGDRRNDLALWRLGGVGEAPFHVRPPRALPARSFLRVQPFRVPLSQWGSHLLSRLWDGRAAPRLERRFRPAGSRGGREGRAH